MKSYFAKLAARATLGNSPASPVGNATKLSDPFEAATETSDSLSASSQPVMPPERVQPVLPAFRDPPLESSKPATVLQRPLPTRLPTESHADIKLEPPPSATDTKPQRAESTLEPDLDGEISVSPIQPITAPATHSPRSSSDEADSQSIEMERVEGDLAEIRREQVKLLRKADNFMERLFDRRTQSTAGPEDQSDHESRSRTEISIPPAGVPRLQPAPAVRQVREQNSAQPSLVIGKLTVEVVPPAPAPAPPPQQIVVVRGSRGGRNGIPSSRRFGLAQF